MVTEVQTDELTRETRVLLGLFTGLTLLGFVALVPGAVRTDESFAWTIQPPVTAAFLGFGYLSGTVLVVLALLSGSWAVTRVPVAVIGAFTWLTLLATLVHLDRFHLDGEGLPWAAAWFWLAVYVLLPVGIVAVLLAHRRDVGFPGPATPDTLRLALTVEAVVLGATGLVLYLLPDRAGDLWPWPLTPLTARAVASWLLAYALAAAVLGRAGPVARLRVPAVAYAVFGAGSLAVGLVAVAGDEAEPADLRTLGYLLVALVLLGTGLAISRRAGPPALGRAAP